ncbi:hypothetical protein BBJ41_37360 [Burkholderia stabilis]|uniref:MFS transporter n=1 Tax=Burkholderia stabilis TaxID=95485 RepID=UPI0008516869|nr:MFS transporter [Burkholderia stabilis]AOR73205.1 hypothetical protein BBJ41_37360 [Burkholderia stabilis]HDR9496328.1 MFS transporter [Burkholderia stabilis]HDR9528012.1 MFS transporter [Burkholderia stabilis]HDR9542894.1 MFS transporter [Burkholderia stabilis]HDR9573126.1 MFS transporter [Burkholderia stabilis]
MSVMSRRLSEYQRDVMRRLVRVHLSAAVGMFSQASVLLALSPALFTKYQSATLASIAFSTVWFPALCLVPLSHRIMTRFRLRRLYLVSELLGAVVLAMAGTLFDSNAFLALAMLFVRGFFGAISYTAATLYVKGAAEPEIVRKEISAFEASRLVGSMLSSVAGWVTLNQVGFQTVCLTAACVSVVGAAISLTWQREVSIDDTQSRFVGKQATWLNALAPSVAMLLLLLSTVPLQAFHHAARTPLAVEYLDLGVRGVAIVVLVNTVSVAAGAWFASFAIPTLEKYGHWIYVILNTVSGLLMVTTPVLRNPVICLSAYGAYLFVFQVCYTAINSAMIADASASAATILVPVRAGIVQAALLVFAPTLGVIADRGGLEAASLLAAVTAVGLAAGVVLAKPRGVPNTLA